MGVVYKLKKEIVDFIINEKKLNPSLGCRNLVGLVEAKFQTKISKSAINEVIKSAQLSSSIGRRPLVIRNHLKVSKTLSFPNAFPPKIVGPSSLREEEAFLKSSQDKGVLFDGAGCFFLKAAQWELFRRPMLGKMISKYVSPELINGADILMEVLLFLPMFGIQLSEITAGRDSGLWAIHGLTQSIKGDKFLSLVNGLQDKKDFSLRLSNEIPQIFSEAVYSKIVLEDQTELVLDAQCRNLRSIKERLVYYSSPIEKSLERLIGNIIANGRPAIIKNISTEIVGAQDDYGFSPSVYQWISAFENMPGKRMVKAAILNEHGEEISTFSAIPFKRRFFIMGSYSKISRSLSFPNALVGNPDETIIRPPTKTFGGDSLGITSITVQDETLEFCEESFLVKKNSILTKDLRLRAIFIKKPDSKDQGLGVLLTNIPKSAQSSAEVISEYLKEWPIKTFGDDNFGIGSNIEDSEADKDFYNDTKISFNPEEIPNLWNNLGAILLGFNKYCQRHFFPKNYARMDISVLKERFYQLEGYLKKGSGCLEVNLILPQGYAYRPDLEHAVRKLNEFQIKNYAGQTVFLKIVP